jgi:hypothetical protein
MKCKSKAVCAFAMLAAARLVFADMEFRQAPPTRLIVEHRILTHYADGGEFTGSPMTQVEHVDRLRKFIWRHWSEKTRGYARLSMSGIDSTTTTYLFVEPDQAGVWRVACRQLDIGYPCRPVRMVPTEHTVGDLCGMEAARGWKETDSKE